MYALSRAARLNYRSTAHFTLREERVAAPMCLAPAQTLSKRREVGSFPTPGYNKLKLFTRHGKRKRHDIEVLARKRRLFNPEHILVCCSEYVCIRANGLQATVAGTIYVIWVRFWSELITIYSI